MEEYRVPAVDRAIAMLGILEAHKDGLTGPELAAEAKFPKSTVYRILNSLEAGDIVRRVDSSGRYVLGNRLLGLAAKVRSRFHTDDLIKIARLHMETLSHSTGASSKLSVMDGDKAACIDVVYGSSEFSVAPTIGRRFPIHAGAASKLFLAHMDPKTKAELTAQRLENYTESTISDIAKLDVELQEILAQGWSEDRGEHNKNVAAIAAPILDSNGRIVAAVSIAYFSSHHEEMKSIALAPTIQCAKSISNALSGPDPVSETCPSR